jgi:hypothetical protein
MSMTLSRKIMGYVILLISLWMMTSPQSTLGLEELKWMSDYQFPLEAFLGALLACVAFLFIRPSKPDNL